MTKKVGIIGAAVAALSFGALAVGATYAIFTARTESRIHIKSGNVKAKLYMVDFQRDELDEDGQWISYENNHVDLEDEDSPYGAYEYVEDISDSDYSGINVSVKDTQNPLFSDILLVPGMKGIATFMLVNEGTVAINYQAAATNVQWYKGDLITTSAPALAGDLTYDDFDNGSGTVNAGAYAIFTLTYEFRDDGKDDNGVGLNNDAMDQSVSFDMRVDCEQVTRPNNQQQNP